MIPDINEQIRSFIAIEMPEGLAKKLQRLQENMRKANPVGIKWVEAHNIHLTLKFLGNIKQITVHQIASILKDVCSSFSAFSLTAGTLGAFPNVRQPRVFWFGLEGQLEPLLALQKAIDDRLVPLGFAPETRPFTPHLTLARVKEGTAPPIRQAFGDLITKTSWENGYAIEINKVNLMKSQLFPTGPVYSHLAEIGLKSPE